MKTDYTNLDDLILKRVREKQGATFTELLASLWALADAIAPKNRLGKPQGFRAIDRRLQSLRKAGRITFDRKAGKWVEVKA